MRGENTNKLQILRRVLIIWITSGMLFFVLCFCYTGIYTYNTVDRHNIYQCFLKHVHHYLNSFEFCLCCLIAFGCLNTRLIKILPFVLSKSFKAETNMNWNWISRDIGKSFVHLVLKRYDDVLKRSRVLLNCCFWLMLLLMPPLLL